jgi:hypothetical protein
VLLHATNATEAVHRPGATALGTPERPRPEYDCRMIRQNGPGRTAIFALAMGFLVGIAAAPASAQDHRSRSTSQAKPATGGKAAAKPEQKSSTTRGKSTASEPAKPGLLENFGSWAAYAAGSGKAKTCYALGQPQDRKPELKRDPAFLFVSTRPGENVRNEVSIVMGFDVKPDAAATAQVGSANFKLVAKGANLWIENLADNEKLVAAMRSGSRLIVKAPSKRGNSTTDSYSLSGLAQALDRVRKECS